MPLIADTLTKFIESKCTFLVEDKWCGGMHLPMPWRKKKGKPQKIESIAADTTKFIDKNTA